MSVLIPEKGKPVVTVDLQEFEDMKKALKSISDGMVIKVSGKFINSNNWYISSDDYYTDYFFSGGDLQREILNLIEKQNLIIKEIDSVREKAEKDITDKLSAMSVKEFKRWKHTYHKFKIS